MSSSALRIIAILLAIGAAVMGYMGYQASQQPVETDKAEAETEAPPEPQQYPVIVATTEIPAGEIIEAGDLTTHEVTHQPDNSFIDKQQLIGREVKLPVHPDDMLLSEHFHSPSTLVKNIRPGERAVAVRVDEVTGTGGFIQPGDRVDVLLYLQSGQEMGDASSAQRLLSDIRVLAYGNDVAKTDAERVREKARAYLQKDKDSNLAERLGDGDSEATETDDDDEEVSGKKSKTAVLAVTAEQTSALLLAESTGRLRLALLGDDEVDISTTEESAEHHFVVLKTFNRETSAKPANTNKSTTVPAPQKKQVIINHGAKETSITLEQEN